MSHYFTKLLPPSIYNKGIACVRLCKGLQNTIQEKKNKKILLLI